MSIDKALRFLVPLALVWTHVAEAAPSIEHWVTPGGSRVYFVRAEGLPLLDARVVFSAGSARDGAQFGVANLTSALLDSGAGEWDADAIARRLEGVGAVLATGATRDSSWLSLRTLTGPGQMDVALDVARAVLAAPRFAPRDFAREKQRALLALREEEESPTDLAANAYFAALYGQHPYAHPVTGTPDQVTRLGREDVVRFHRRHYAAANAWVVLVGDIDRPQAEDIATRLTADLPRAVALDPVPLAPEDGASVEVRTPFPSQQTHILVGAPVLPFNDPDYFPLYVGNHILGGSGLVSRISEEVREKRGLSYSAYSYFQPLAARGPFTMGLQTRNDQADEALGVLQGTLARFIAEGPSEEELAASQKNISGGFVLRVDSNQKIAETVATIALYGLPLDYLETFIAKVEAVRREDILRVFRARIRPQALRVIRVGGGA